MQNNADFNQTIQNNADFQCKHQFLLRAMTYFRNRLHAIIFVDITAMVSQVTTSLEVTFLNRSRVDVKIGSRPDGVTVSGG